MSPESFKLEMMKAELTGIILAIDKLSDTMYLLSKKSGEVIEAKFHDEVTNGLKQLVAMAENIEAQRRLSESFVKKAS